MTLIACFAAIYVVWGSTYIAIRLLADTLPPFTMVGLRFLIAGALVYGWVYTRPVERATARQWRSASLAGLFLIFFGTGAVVWAVQHVDSGLVALLVGMEPLWMAVLIWVLPFARDREHRPTLGTFAVLALGFSGAAILAAPTEVLGAPIHLPSVLVVAFGCISWAGGSLWLRQADMPESSWESTAIQMLVGGAALSAYGLAIGEWGAFDPSAVSLTSLLAFAYLVVFGSLVAFSAYAWLIQHAEPTLVATHAYVNPVVAVFLGWWLADEAITTRTVLASVLIVGSVVLMTTEEGRRKRREARSDAEATA